MNKERIQSTAALQGDGCLDPGPFYHGTKADLKPGELLEPGFSSNYGERKKSNFIYFTATMDAAMTGSITPYVVSSGGGGGGSSSSTNATLSDY
jgi:hypothetical protein